MANFVDLASTAIAEMQEKSRKRIYQTDPEAWLWDILGRRWWSKQAEIAHAVVGDGSSQTFTLVKSANGTGKTQLGADLMTWAVSVHDPIETTVLATANVFSQISDNAFKYITNNYGTVEQRIRDGVLAEHNKLPGRIVSDPAVRFERGAGLMPKNIIIGRRPADKNLISSFQGTHDGFVFVLMDEAGGLPEDLWVGAYAVTTNEHTAILAIGNPDELNTGFHRRFEDPNKYSDWRRFTLSAYDTPNFTGEVLYPENPAMEKAMRSRMIQVGWAERMKKEAHPDVYLAKVLGEFPKSDSASFFPPSTINQAYNTEIEPRGDAPRWLGVDLAFSGSDKTALYLNTGGHIRKVNEWIHEDDFMKVANMIHQEALKYGVDQVRVDAAGTGKGIFSLLETQFDRAPYELYGIQGGERTPDSSQWAQARAWHFDYFRRKMASGEIDLDPNDEELRTELTVQTYELNRKGAIQITPKSVMRSAGLHSPDYLDAAIYSAIDLDELYGDPHGPKPGDKIPVDPSEINSQFSGEDLFYASQYAVEF